MRPFITDMQEHDQTNAALKHYNALFCVDKDFLGFQRLHFSFSKWLHWELVKRTPSHELYGICFKIRQHPIIFRDNNWLDICRIWSDITIL